MSHYTEISPPTLWLLCIRQEWVAGLTPTRHVTLYVWDDVCQVVDKNVYVYVRGVDVSLCMSASICCFRGCVDRTQKMRLVSSVFPALVCTSPPLLLSTSFLLELLGKISSKPTSLCAAGLTHRGCEVTQLMDHLSEVF